MRGSIDKLQTTITNLDKTMKNMETVTDRLEKGDGTVGKLLTDDTIARNVEEITEDAGGFVRSITKLQTIVGLRSEYNFLSSTFKNYLSIQLMPRPDKFYLIELVEDPRGYRSRDDDDHQQLGHRHPVGDARHDLRAAPLLAAVRQARRPRRGALRHQGIDGRRRRATFTCSTIG